MVKYNQIIRRKQPTNCLSVFYHFVGLALKGLKRIELKIILQLFMLNYFRLVKKTRKTEICEILTCKNQFTYLV